MAEKQNTQNQVGSKFERRKLSPSSSSSILLRCVTKFERLLSPPPRPRAPIQEKRRTRRTGSDPWSGYLAKHARFHHFGHAPKLVINHLQALKSSEESLREQLEEAKKKEAAFIVTLAASIVTLAKREQEIADLKSAVWDLKAQLKPAAMQARRLLLDPAIHEEFTRLKNLVEEKDNRVKELQDNIAAVNLTRQSKLGKVLMAECRTLHDENEEIGNQASEGKMHELATKLSLQKYQNAELISQFEGLQKNMDGLTNDVERSNEMVFMLQAKLDEKEQEIQRLEYELQRRGNLAIMEHMLRVRRNGSNHVSDWL